MVMKVHLTFLEANVVFVVAVIVVVVAAAVIVVFYNVVFWFLLLFLIILCTILVKQCLYETAGGRIIESILFGAYRVSTNTLDTLFFATSQPPKHIG